MLEKTLENYFIREVKKRGGLALKLQALSMAGFPDRTVFFPNGMIYFVELKQEGKKPTKLQQQMIDKLRNFGFKAYVIDTKEKVRQFLELAEHLNAV